jgi:GTP 3',8-cyclase
MINHEDILTYEELYRLISISASLAIKTVRITGGEPLVRKGVVDFIPILTGIPGIEDVSLPINGVCLKNNLKKIYEGGVHRINISLDT